MSKKAMIGEQVNWVYVMIAGTLILLFFIALIYKQKEAAEAAIEEEAIKNIELITAQPARSTQLLKMPKLELDKTCSSGETTIKAGDSYPTRPSDPVFGPSTIRSNEVMATTDEWNIPFKTTNLVYLTANDTRYIVLKALSDAPSERLAKQIIDSLPVQANKNTRPITASDTIINTNSRRIVIIGAGTDPRPAIVNWMREKPAKDITVIKVTRETGKESGKITYYEKNAASEFEQGQATVYIEHPMMMAAIYSDSLEELNCATQKAYQRLGPVSTVYSERVRQIKNSPELTQSCKDKYGEADNWLAQLARLNSQGDNMVAVMESLSLKNRELLLNSCPTIY
ncbi:hypothetical protein HY640_02495 [Candidatus Woesearchaeota archaeon]|nr:hypothetical protein [Candidatus Woesearchaeota archaeon]